MTDTDANTDLPATSPLVFRAMLIITPLAAAAHAVWHPIAHALGWGCL